MTEVSEAGLSPASRLFGVEAPLEYSPGVDANDAGVLMTVPDKQEAEIVCGLLRSAGFECGYRDTEAIDSLLEDFIASGSREILVHTSDLEAARAALADVAR